MNTSEKLYRDIERLKELNELLRDLYVVNDGGFKRRLGWAIEDIERHSDLLIKENEVYRRGVMLRQLEKEAV